jgi:hypothetical protein
MACSLPQNEDKIFELSSIPPTPEINCLTTHQMLLGQLIASSKKFKKTSVQQGPAYLHAGQTISGIPLEITQLKNNLVIFPGDLSQLDQTRIYH